MDMKLSKFLRSCVVMMTCTGMLSAQLAQAAGAATQETSATRTIAPQHQIQDVSLQDHGVFSGTVLDKSGAPRASVPVAVSRQSQVVARTETDASGRFTVQGLTGGVYEVRTPVGSGVYRLWAPRTAPPAAHSIATVTSDQAVVRAQMGLQNGGSALSWLANPWVLAGVVAAAIAIPLALDDDDAS
jgi:hypothetical protein